MSKEIIGLLEDIGEKIDADSVLLATMDGISMFNTDISSINSDVQSAMSAAMLAISETAANSLRFEHCDMNITMFKSVGRKLIVIGVGEKYLLSIIADVGIDENTIEALIAKETNRIREIMKS